MTDDMFQTPKGLDSELFGNLAKAKRLAAESSLGDLLASAEAHANGVEAYRDQNPFLNVKLAEAIGATLQKLAAVWENLTKEQQDWLKGAIGYFVDSGDEIPDYSSPIGFQDDLKVLNACLRFAQLSDWCLDLEDFFNA